MGPKGKVVKIDKLGGVFAPIPGQPIRIVYSVGHHDAKAKDPMFTCPVSAIPGGIFELLGIWNECRLSRSPFPRAGALLDQPLIVRLAFVWFWNEWATIDAANGQSGAAATAGLAAATVLKAAFGGK